MLEATAYPIRFIETEILQKLSNKCNSFESNTLQKQPNISLIEWVYSNETFRISCPFSYIRQKISKQAFLWKQYLSDTVYSNGYSDINPYIITDLGEKQNLLDHISLNGIKKCRDIDIIIYEKDSNDNDICIKYNQMDVVEIVRISNHHRIHGLNGQFTIRSKIKYIPSNTVIGRFCGDEMFTFEYNLVYGGTCEYEMRNHYKMSIKCPRDLWNRRKCPFRRESKIVLDELGPFPANPMVIMNDVRQNISHYRMTKDDMKHWNADYRHVYINGWPFLYIITSKPIYMGQEIATYYGSGYVL